MPQLYDSHFQSGADGIGIEPHGSAVQRSVDRKQSVIAIQFLLRKNNELTAELKHIVVILTYSNGFAEESVMSVVVQHGADGEIRDLGCPAGGAGPAGNQQTQPERSQRHR